MPSHSDSPEGGELEMEEDLNVDSVVWRNDLIDAEQIQVYVSRILTINILKLYCISYLSFCIILLLYKASTVCLWSRQFWSNSAECSDLWKESQDFSSFEIT